MGMLWHLHLRKRISKALEPYPSRHFWKWLLDGVVYTVGIIGPVMALPQILLIYGGRDATGVSSVAWFSWALMDIPWILYGIVHKERPIIITYTLWLACNVLIGIGAIIY